MTDDPNEAIRAHREGGLVHVELCRPHKRNALTAAMFRRLDVLLAEAESDPGVRAILLSGSGTTYCAGYDVEEFTTDPPSDLDAPVFGFLERLIALETPIVAAVDGPCAGIGATMLLHLDLVFATPEASLRFPFVPLGLCPEGASTLLLPQRLGRVRTTEVLLLGEPILAAEARVLGLVNQVVPRSELLTHARAQAERLAALPPEAVRTTKQLLHFADRAVVQKTLEREARAFFDRVRSEEAQAALRRFLAR